MKCDVLHEREFAKLRAHYVLLLWGCGHPIVSVVRVGIPARKIGEIHYWIPRKKNKTKRGYSFYFRSLRIIILLSRRHFYFLGELASITDISTRKKKYGRCSDTTTNNTQDTIWTTLIYLMQPYDTSNSYILFSTTVLSPEWYCMSTGMQRFVRIRARAV